VYPTIAHRRRHATLLIRGWPNPGEVLLLPGAFANVELTLTRRPTRSWFRRGRDSDFEPAFVFVVQEASIRPQGRDRGPDESRVQTCPVSTGTGVTSGCELKSGSLVEVSSRSRMPPSYADDLAELRFAGPSDDRGVAARDARRSRGSHAPAGPRVPRIDPPSCRLARSIGAPRRSSRPRSGAARGRDQHRRGITSLDRRAARVAADLRRFSLDTTSRRPATCATRLSVAAAARGRRSAVLNKSDADRSRSSGFHKQRPALQLELGAYADRCARAAKPVPGIAGVMQPRETHACGCGSTRELRAYGLSPLSSRAVSAELELVRRIEGTRSARSQDAVEDRHAGGFNALVIKRIATALFGSVTSVRELVRRMSAARRIWATSRLAGLYFKP